MRNLKTSYNVIEVPAGYKKFTVTFTEAANSTDFNPVWSDDAAGLTAGSTAFDEFFGYSAVRLNTSGVETAEITQTQSGGAGKNILSTSLP